MLMMVVESRWSVCGCLMSFSFAVCVEIFIMKCQGRVAWRERALRAGLVCLEQKVTSPEWVSCSQGQNPRLAGRLGSFRGKPLAGHRLAETTSSDLETFHLG